MENDIAQVKIEEGERRNSTPGEDDTVRNKRLLYSVEEVPPWYLCIALGFQHYLTAFGSTITVPLVLYTSFCMGEDRVGLGELINTIFFVSGIATLLQTTLGIRLPIIQGATFAFLPPTIAILKLDRWDCPYTNGKYNITDLPAYGSDKHRDIWQARIREIQGAIMCASLFQVFIGATGLIGFAMRYIGPLTVAPTVALVGMALFTEAANLASKQWYIALMTIFFMALFSQYLRKVYVPVCRYEKGKGFSKYKIPIFSLFPVVFAMLLSWIICGILTGAGALTEDKNGWGYNARTDTKLSVLKDAQWFKFPYPGQWGVPTVSVAGVFGMLSGVLASMMESIGDYFACANLSGAPPPPTHAINRGIAVEGIGCILAGAWGSGNGTTSYSENVGAIGITKVGSRRVVQVGGALMIILGCLGKFGALFVTIPDPVLGGVFMVMFGMITAVGISSLQHVDLNSSRNIFIVGFSLFFGLSFPFWMKQHTDDINTGNEIANQILTVLLSTSMFVGGVIGFILDNTMPGTPEERGLTKWRAMKPGSQSASDISTTYDLPLIQTYLNKISFLRYLPFCPSFEPKACCGSCRSKPSEDNYNSVNKAYQNDTAENTNM